jgi:hypothetical protein
VRLAAGEGAEFGKPLGLARAALEAVDPPVGGKDDGGGDDEAAQATDEQPPREWALSAGKVGARGPGGKGGEGVGGGE